MKPFVINRNSWHYKLNREFFNPSQYSMQYSWEPRHSDFCSYWRATVFRVLWIVLLLGVIVFLIAGAGYVVYTNPWESLFFVGTLLITVAVMVGLAVLGHVAETWWYKRKKTEKPESLLAQKYRAHKAKICPMVDYK
jgi:MFS family permease